MDERMKGRVSVRGNQTHESYWKGWPVKCPYLDDLKWACTLSIKYLKKIAPKFQNSNRKGIVVFDIDDTILQGDPADVIGIREMEMGKINDQEIFILPPNKFVQKVAEEARNLGFSIVCLTARPESSRLASITNLNMFDIPFDAIIMNNKDEDYFFKIRTRRQLEKNNQTVVLTIGDDPFDVLQPRRAAAIKLPNPDLMGAYAYFPPSI